MLVIVFVVYLLSRPQITRIKTTSFLKETTRHDTCNAQR